MEGVFSRVVIGGGSWVEVGQTIAKFIGKTQETQKITLIFAKTPEYPNN